jgi:hypothetical protein
MTRILLIDDAQQSLDFVKWALGEEHEIIFVSGYEDFYNRNELTKGIKFKHPKEDKVYGENIGDR